MPTPFKWTAGSKVSGSDYNNVRLYREPSYILFAESGSTSTLYYAYAQYSGSTDYSGSDAGAVLQSVLNVLQTGSILIKDGTFNAGQGVTIQSDNISLIFKTAVWKLNAGAANSGISIFVAKGKKYLFFDFINSYIDCNIAGQSPGATNYITGLDITGSSYISIPHFKGTGFGSNQCLGFAASFIQDSYVDIGYFEAHDCGGDAIAIQCCHDMMIDRIYAENVSKKDPGAGAFTIFNLISPITQDSYNININAVTTISGAFSARIAADSGSTHHVTIGQVLAKNLFSGAALSIDSTLTAGGASWPYECYAISVGQVIGEYITGSGPGGSTADGVRISSGVRYNTHDIDIGSIYIKDMFTGSHAGLFVYRSRDVNVGSCHVDNTWFDGVHIEDSLKINVDNINVYNCANVNNYNTSGVLLYSSSYCNIVANQIIDDRGASAKHYSAFYEQDASNYNNITIGYATGSIGALYTMVGANSSLKAYKADGIAATGSSLIIGDAYLAGAGTTSLSQSGKVITISSTGTAGTASSGSMGPYSYIIYSGALVGTAGPYFAKDKDGYLVYSGSDPAFVANSCIESGSISTNGGKLFFKNGFYRLLNPIYINKNNITIEGEISGRYALNADGGTIFYASNTDAIQITSSAYGYTTNIHIKNIKFGSDSVNMGGHGITNHILGDLNSFSFSSIKNCTFMSFIENKFAINIKNYENIVISECDFKSGATGMVHIYSTGYSSSDLTLENSELAPEHSGSFCIIIESCPSDWTGSYSGDPQGCGRLTFNRNHFMSWAAVPGNRGVKIYADNIGVEDIEFFRCIFEGMDLYITGSSTYPKVVDRIYMVDSYILWDSAAYLTTMVDITENVGNVHLLNCYFSSDNLGVTAIKNRASWSASYPTYIDSCVFIGNMPTYIDTAGGYIKYGDNFGWTRTNNSGYQSISATSGSFAHGLLLTPNNIYVTPSGSTYKGSLQAWPSGSAGIWVQQTGSGTVNFYWKAEM